MRVAIAASNGWPVSAASRLSAMPPSTATNVRPVCLTVVTRYNVTHERATSERPGSMTSLAPAGRYAAAAAVMVSRYCSTVGASSWSV